MTSWCRAAALTETKISTESVDRFGGGVNKPRQYKDKAVVTRARTPHRNAWNDYVRALHAASDWLVLARQSQDQRHLETAITCSRIARERLDRLLAEDLDPARRHELRLLELEAQTAAHVDEVRQQLAESRALLDAPVRRLPGSACA
jgi:hypothetical protein